jgi:hypothetical protein
MISKVNKIVLLVLLINVFLLSIFSWRWADDYGMYNNIIKAGGVFQSLKFGYFNWDGRFFSFIAIIQACLLKLQSAELGAVIWVSCFLFAGHYLFKELSYLFFLNKYVTFIIACFILHGLREVASESVFWLAGGFYSATILILMFWFYRTRTLIFELNANYSFNFFFLIVLTIVSSQNGPQVSASMFVSLLSLSIIKDRFFYKKKWFYRNVVPLLLITIIFALITILAPGNNARIEANETKLNLFDFNQLLNNFIRVFKVYIYYNLYLFFSLSVILFPVSLIIKETFIDIKIKYFTSFKLIFSYLIIAFSSISPFVLYPDFAAPRTILIFSFFFILFLIPHIVLFYKYIFFKLNILQTEKYYVFVLLIVLIPLIVIEFSWIKRSYIAKTEINKRYDLLYNFKNSKKDIKVEKLNLDLPQIKVFHDIQDDTCHYINHDLAEYYGLKSIGYKEIKKNDKK